MYNNIIFCVGRYVAEAIDVFNRGSKISVINGQTGQYMVHRTQSVTTAFEELRNLSGSCNKNKKNSFERINNSNFL